MARRWYVLLALAAVLGTAWVGTSESAVRDTMVFGPNSDALTLDPHTMNDNTSEQAICMLYDNLVKFDKDRNIVGELAESWQVSDDGRTWTFKLRQGVTFHDGTLLDSKAVQKTFERVTDKENNLNRYQLYAIIEKVDAPDANTVVFTTKEPFGAFLAILAHTSGGILNPAIIDKFGKDLGKSTESVCGSGPYKIGSWTKDQELVLERNDAYWGDKGITKRIVYRPIPEAASRIMALETGEVDVIQQIPAKELERLEKTEGILVVKTPANGQRQFRFDCSKPPFDNKLVRLAVSSAINRQDIVDHVVRGLGVPSRGPLASVTWGHVDLGTVPYDPEKAKALLKEAGYGDGLKIRITTTERYVQGTELAEVLAEQLKMVGIEAEVNVMEWSAIAKEWGGLKPEQFNQGFFIMGTGPSTGDADWGLRPIYHTAPTNEQNYGFYSNKEFDGLIEKGMRETDPAKRKEFYRRAQEIVYLEDPVAVWLYDQYAIIGTRTNVKDVTVSPLSLVTFEKAYVEE